ncbi:MAG: hypothetical protein AB7L13_07445 [Acidimicrobiia bacterium]
MSTTFDVAGQTKAAGDQILTLIGQAQQATLASVKTVSGLTAPMMDKMPALPMMPATGDVKALMETGFAFMTSLMDSQKAFAGELFDTMAPKAPAPAKAAKA